MTIHYLRQHCGRSHIDESGYRNHGTRTIVGVDLTWGLGPSDRMPAMRWPASAGGTRIVIPSSDSISIGTSAFTFSLWTRFHTPGSTDLVMSVDGSNNGGGVIAAVGGNIVFFQLGSERITGPAATAHVWYHVALVGNGLGAGSRNTKLYVGGLQGGSTYTNDYNVPATDFWLGSNHSSGGQEHYGDIADFRFYRRALSEAEIKLLADQGERQVWGRPVTLTSDGIARGRVQGYVFG